jgi:hypothetical protein
MQPHDSVRSFAHQARLVPQSGEAPAALAQHEESLSLRPGRTCRSDSNAYMMSTSAVCFLVIESENLPSYKTRQTFQRMVRRVCHDVRHVSAKRVVVPTSLPEAEQSC